MADGTDDLERLLEAVIAHPRVRAGLDWGEPRAGHPEGAVRAHVAELERGLEAMRPRLTAREHAALRVLIHAHDALKHEAPSPIPLADPRAHGALAGDLLAELGADADLVAMARWHDEPLAIHRHRRANGRLDEARLAALRGRIADWDLFVAFLLLDGRTTGKDRAPLRELFEALGPRMGTRWTPADAE